MHNLKEIRKDFDSFIESLQKRNVDIDFTQLKKLDKINRELIQKKEVFEQEKKNISKSKDESQFKKSKEISNQLDLISNEQKKIKNELDILLLNIPNIPHPDVQMEKMKIKMSKYQDQVKFRISILIPKLIMN